MKKLIILSLFVLTGCYANSQISRFHPAPNSHVTDETASRDWYSCDHEAWNIYYDERPSYGAAGLLGGPFGAIGGAIAGGIVGASDTRTHKMQPSDIAPYTDNCMKKKGYVKATQ